MTIQVKFGEIAQQFRGRWCCCLTAASLVQTLPVLWVFEDRPQAQRGKIHLDTWGVLVIVWIQPLSSNSGKWWCIGMDLLLRKYNPFLLVTVTPGGVVYPSYSSKELHVSSPFASDSILDFQHVFPFSLSSPFLGGHIFWPRTCQDHVDTKKEGDTSWYPSTHLWRSHRHLNCRCDCKDNLYFDVYILLTTSKKQRVPWKVCVDLALTNPVSLQKKHLQTIRGRTLECIHHRSLQAQHCSTEAMYPVDVVRAICPSGCRWMGNGGWGKMIPKDRVISFSRCFWMRCFFLP